MREIKFRAWDAEQKHMAYQGDPDIETIQSFFYHFGNDILMEYVGIKDRNGKEIFEGDIIRYFIKRMFWHPEEEVVETEVRIDYGYCNISPDVIEWQEESGAEDVGARVEWIEVIGNIYEGNI